MNTPPARKRYGRRAPGMTQTTVTLPDEVFEKATKFAKKKGKSLSQLVVELIEGDK